MVDFGKSDKRIKMNGKMDKPMKYEILNPLSVFSLSTSHPIYIYMYSIIRSS